MFAKPFLRLAVPETLYAKGIHPGPLFKRAPADPLEEGRGCAGWKQPSHSLQFLPTALGLWRVTGPGTVGRQGYK